MEADQKLADRQSTCQWMWLTTEMLELIFLRLDVTTVYGRCVRVCTRWRDVVSFSPILERQFRSEVKFRRYSTGQHGHPRTLVCHSVAEPSHAVEVTQEGMVLIGSGSVIRVYSKDGMFLRALRGHDNTVKSISIQESQDRVTVYSGSDDRSVRVWDLRTGVLLETLSRHTGSVWALATCHTSHGAVIIFSGSYDWTIRMWTQRAAAGSNSSTQHEETATLSEHEGGVCALAISQSGDRLFSGSYDGDIRIWDVYSGQSLKIIHCLYCVASLCVAPDGKIWSGCWRGKIRVISPTGDQIFTIEQAHRAYIKCLTSFPQSNFVFSAPCDELSFGHEDTVMSPTKGRDPRHAIRVWSLEGDLVTTLCGQSAGYHSLAAGPENMLYASEMAGRVTVAW